MISPRPWKLESRLVERYGDDIHICGFVDAAGAFHECEWLDVDEINYIVACVNAIHAAGIDPADLPKLTAEVERLRKNIERLEEKLAENEVEGVCRMCGKRFPSSSW